MHRLAASPLAEAMAAVTDHGAEAAGQLLLSSADPRGRQLASPDEPGGPSPSRPFAASLVAGRGAACEAGPNSP